MYSTSVILLCSSRLISQLEFPILLPLSISQALEAEIFL